MKRFYLAITNHCNRECELCCTFSDPTRKTFLSYEWIEKYLSSQTSEYEAQLEGGEPTMHPDYYRIIDYLNNDNNCIKIVLTTNASMFPYVFDSNRKVDKKRSFESLVDYFKMIQKPFTLKPSINNYLIERDSNLLDKAEILKDVICYIEDEDHDFRINFNVRKRAVGDQWILDELENRNLLGMSNVFFFQKYGKAKDLEDYELPFIIDNPVEFYLISPDGKVFENSTDCLVLRSEHMKNLS